MNRRVLFRPRALADLDDIWTHTVDRWSTAQARRYLEGLDGILALLCEQPEIARQHDFTPPVRLFPYREHLLVFVAGGAELEVIRILHLRSNWRVLLAD